MVILEPGHFDVIFKCFKATLKAGDATNGRPLKARCHLNDWVDEHPNDVCLLDRRVVHCLARVVARKGELQIGEVEGTITEDL